MMPILRSLFVYGLLFSMSLGNAAAYELVSCDNLSQARLNFDFHSDKIEYQAGETVRFRLIVRNPSDVPVADGKIRIKITRAANNTDLIVDEFLLPSDVNLMENNEFISGFDWKLPANAAEDVYTAKMYFVMGEKFSVGSNGITPFEHAAEEDESVSFNVISGANSLYIDTGSIFINEMPASPFGSSFYENTPINFKVRLISFGIPASTLSLDIITEDDLFGNPMVIFHEARTVSFQDSYNQDISITADVPKAEYYLVRLNASYGESQAIQKLQIVSPASKVRIKSLGLHRFPLKKDEEGLIALCLNNDAPISLYPIAVKGTISLSSDSGIIWEEKLNDIIVREERGIVIKFKPKMNYEFVTLATGFENKNGNVQDSAKLVYDYTKFLTGERKLHISLARTEYKTGDTAAYTVRLVNGKGELIAETISLYFTDPSSAVIHTNSGKGELKGALILSKEGNYEIVAVQSTFDMSESKSFFVGNIRGTGNDDVKKPPPEESPTETPEKVEQTEKTVKSEDGELSLFPIFVIIAILAIIALVIIILKGREAKKDEMETPL